MIAGVRLILDRLACDRDIAPDLADELLLEREQTLPIPLDFPECSLSACRYCYQITAPRRSRHEKGLPCGGGVWIGELRSLVCQSTSAADRSITWGVSLESLRVGH